MTFSGFLTNWIWTPNWSEVDESKSRLVCFRREFFLEKIPDEMALKISADSRYKLYVNGCFVQEGPQKAVSTKEWFVDTAQIGEWIHSGMNVMAVEVLRYPESKRTLFAVNANDSLLRTPIPNLFVGGNILLDGKSGWKCCINRRIHIVGTSDGPIHALENASGSAAFSGWKLPGYDDSSWQTVRNYTLFELNNCLAPANQIPRNIPTMQHEDHRFESVVTIREGTVTANDAQKMLRGEAALHIPPNSMQIIEISAGVEENAYLLYRLAGGTGARITTLCAECYSYPGEEGQMRKKGNREDWENGELDGHDSVYTVAGYGTLEVPEEYEPYWFRSFRHIRLTVETAGEPLDLLDFSFRSTNYPLEVKTWVKTSDATLEPIWDISVRTLQRCMHETYFDCPFYEQLQYAMDTRSEILYTYAVSADDRLARQAIEAFRCAQRPDGMIAADTPSQKGVIPGFGIYYILMVYDHMMYFGDQTLVRQNLPAIDGVLNFFRERLLDTGLLGRLGGRLLDSPYWSFIDWADKWDAGVPGAAAVGEGSITMESLLYAYGLQKAGELACFVGRNGVAEEYQNRAQAVLDAVYAHCLGENGLIQDGPGVEEYSVHCQIFAILTGLATPEQGKRILQISIGNPAMAQATVAFRFYLFRALELCGWYDKTDELWEIWRQMVRDNLSTCAESDTQPRSDCHAWASLICYELPAVVLGVQPAAPGYAKVQIKPQMGYLSEASGQVMTPKGPVYVSWSKTEKGLCDLQYRLPEDLELAAQSQ